LVLSLSWPVRDHNGQVEEHRPLRCPNKEGGPG
jgi:hypothetical protein